MSDWGDETLMAAFMAMVGIIGWVIRSGMTRMTRSLDKSTETISEMIRRQDIRDIRYQNAMREHSESIRRVLETQEKLVDQHAPGHTLCRLSEIDADIVRRASKKTLKGSGEG